MAPGLLLGRMQRPCIENIPHYFDFWNTYILVYLVNWTHDTIIFGFTYNYAKLHMDLLCYLIMILVMLSIFSMHIFLLHVVTHVIILL